MRISSRRSLFGPTGPSFDSSAEAYFQAAGITDQTEKQAANALIVGLKDANIWDGIFRLFLFSPTSLDAASYCAKTLTQGTFVNTPTHSANGVLFNGVDQAFTLTGALNAIMPSSQNSACTAVYQRNEIGDITSSDLWYGAGSFTSASQLSLVRLLTSEDLICRIWTSGTNTRVSAQTDARGFYTINRVADLLSCFKNGALEDSASLAPAAPTTSPLSFACRNDNSSLSGFSNIQLAFACLSLAISDQTTLYDLVEAYQVSLGRSVNVALLGGPPAGKEIGGVEKE